MQTPLPTPEPLPKEILYTLGNAAPQLQTVLHKALSPDPADRYPTPHQMQDALREVLRGFDPSATTYINAPTERIEHSTVRLNPVTNANGRLTASPEAELIAHDLYNQIVNSRTVGERELDVMAWVHSKRVDTVSNEFSNTGIFSIASKAHLDSPIAKYVATIVNTQLDTFTLTDLESEEIREAVRPYTLAARLAQQLDEDRTIARSEAERQFRRLIAPLALILLVLVFLVVLIVAI